MPYERVVCEFCGAEVKLSRDCMRGYCEYCGKSYVYRAPQPVILEWNTHCRESSSFVEDRDTRSFELLNFFLNNGNYDDAQFQFAALRKRGVYNVQTVLAQIRLLMLRCICSSDAEKTKSCGMMTTESNSAITAWIDKNNDYLIYDTPIMTVEKGSVIDSTAYEICRLKNILAETFSFVSDAFLTVSVKKKNNYHVAVCYLGDRTSFVVPCQSADKDNVLSHVFGFVAGKCKIKVAQGYNGIGNQCFRSVDNLYAAYLPDSIKKIGRQAFGNLKNLAKISLPYICRNIASDIFQNSPCKIIELYKAENVGKEFSSFFNYLHNKVGVEIVVLRDIKKIHTGAADGLCLKRIYTVGQAMPSTATAGMVLPNTGYEVEHDAFVNLSELTFADFTGAGKIDSNALCKCAELKEIRLPKSMTELDLNVPRKVKRLFL